MDNGETSHRRTVRILQENLDDAQTEIFRLRNKCEKASKRIEYLENRERELWKAFGDFCKAVDNQFKKDDNG